MSGRCLARLGLVPFFTKELSDITGLSTINALCLSKAEHLHLRALVKNPHRPAFSRETVPEIMRRMIASLNHPAYVSGRRWDILEWNDAAADLFTDLGQAPQEDRNVLLFMFTSPATKSLFGASWAAEAKRVLALFRTNFDFWAGDQAFVELRERLRRESAEFARWWETHDVSNSTGVEKLLHHPVRGSIRYDTASFQANDDSSLKLVIYTPLSLRGHEARYPIAQNGLRTCLEGRTIVDALTEGSLITISRTTCIWEGVWGGSGLSTRFVWSVERQAGRRTGRIRGGFSRAIQAPTCSRALEGVRRI